MQGLNDDDRTFPSSMVSVPFPEGARRILLRSLHGSPGGVLVPAARCIAQPRKIHAILKAVKRAQPLGQPRSTSHTRKNYRSTLDFSIS